MASCISLTRKKLAAMMCLLSAALWNLMSVSHLFHDPSQAQAHNRSLTVLIWGWPFGHAFNFTQDVCATLHGTTGCHLTWNRSLYNQSDVVVFHHWVLQHGGSSLPRSKLHPWQKWVWLSLESPAHTKILAGWDGMFNWVMTYRRDSDIFLPYGELVPQPSGNVNIPEKTSLVSWVISNYYHTQERAHLVHDLSKHIKIDVYGKANRKPLCPACLLATISKYKFYLAFENSIYQDYITEKLWRNALLAGTVPVVMGPPRANYQQFIPSEAFIHVDDFSSAKELADFLATMNDSLYRRYFEWKRNYAVKLWDNWAERFCTICQQYPSLPQGKVYPSVERWFQA
ncbi:alpha-(1,3)-fucosyltransferase 7 [Rhineura floridana]|uniref:alpha-(1,3)-fucosyltransferase 7 n=1 Tax=Rhineura floridana TaxID=261503 RepID=UPI002AC88292|nr:alpha-(1,3)-fucosyltransferase 7 [Rhineura floridana]